MLSQRWQLVHHGRRLNQALALAVGLLLVAGATALVAVRMDGAHDGRVAGNEAMVIAAVWGVGGLLLAALERRVHGPALRHGARGLLAAALLYLVMGALLGNARWAVPAVRFASYLGVLGTTWAAEALLVRRDPGSDVNGMLSLTAAAVGYFACAFEVVRWLGPVFTLPLGEPVTPQLLAWQESTRVFITVAVWALYGLGVMEVGRRLRAPAARLLSSAMLGTAIGYTGYAGLTNLAADLTLQAGSVVLVAAAALVAAGLAHVASGERHPREAWAILVLTACGLALPALWGALRLL